MWPESSETQELLAAARRGEADAVNRLLQRHREALRRLVALRMDRALARRVDASDIVQEALLDANRRLADYLDHPALPFHLWLRQMALDRLIDAHRRHRVAARRSLDREQPLAGQRPDESTADPAARLPDPQPTPAAAAAWRELERRFQAALEQLDDDDRNIILLRHFEQLSNQDAARLLSLSDAAASMRYLRALRRLRARLGESADTG
jgi:RNA polymerase sigma-70 factor (ECF subfamily)